MERSTLPKREILCLTRAASLQNRLEKRGGKTGTEQEVKREQRQAEEKQKISNGALLYSEIKLFQRQVIPFYNGRSGHVLSLQSTW